MERFAKGGAAAAAEPESLARVHAAEDAQAAAAEAEASAWRTAS